MDNQVLYGIGKSKDLLTSVYYSIKGADNILKEYTLFDIHQMLAPSIQGFQADVSIDLILQHAQKSFFQGMSIQELQDVLILATVQFIEIDNAYSYVAARLQLKKNYQEVVGYWPNLVQESEYQNAFIKSIKFGVSLEKFDARLLDFDLDYLSQHIDVSRDNLFHYLGIKTLYGKYLKSHKGVVYELPQSFWMRIAMGLALLEKDKNQKAIEFYEIISKLLFVPSTPTLLHAGLKRAQLSSCYLSFIDDDLKEQNICKT